jgi:hypothetical protein
MFEEPSDYLGDPYFNEAYFVNLKSGILSAPIFAHIPWIAKSVCSLHFHRQLLTFKKSIHILISKVRP